MAKVSIVGNAMVVTSSVKLEDIKKVQKYRPDALVLVEKKGFSDETEPVFALSAGDTESFSKYGVRFKEQSRDGGFAQITMYADADHEVTDDEFKLDIADRFGQTLIYLGIVEENIPAVLSEVDENIRKVGDMIEIA